MSLRKIAGLLAASGLVVGLFGSSVGAQFFDSVTAQENINVGTFSCGITGATTGATFGAIDALGYAHTVSYTAPTIMSSAAGSAPFSFTVQNTGSIPDVLTVSTSPVGAPFSIIGAPFAAVPLAAGASHAYATGVKWGVLTNANLGASGTVTWTVNCGEEPGTPLIHYTFKSTNDNNIAGTGPLHPGTIGPSVSVVDNGGGSLTLNFTAGSQDWYASCFEYVTNGNVPQQKIAENGGVNYNNGTTDGDPIVLDGLFPYTCVYSGHTTGSVTLPVGVGGYVEVRMVFGAESDYRFDWTQFNAS